MCHTKTGNRLLLTGRVVEGRINTKEYTARHTTRAKKLLLWVSTSCVSHTRVGRLCGGTEVNGTNLEVNIKLYLAPTKTGILYVPFLICYLECLKG